MTLLPQPDFAHEAALKHQGYHLVAGVDEVGRGPLAGPVVAAAVILTAENLPQGVHDSKRLGRARREQLFGEIVQKARAISIAAITAAEIDASNIRTATLNAMTKALAALQPSPDFALIDGRDIPAALPCPAQALVKGDAQALSIASASIIAKVIRDRMMARAGDVFPLYGFESHAGYGTRKHVQALYQYGIIENWHRSSFAPIKHGMRKA